ncbi:MAG: hypothetical protein QW379_10405 [Thermoplasmata archaeon]
MASIEAGIARVVPPVMDDSSFTEEVPEGRYATKTVVEIPENADTTKGTAGIKLSMTLYLTPPPGAMRDTNYSVWLTTHSCGPSPPKGPVESLESLRVYVRGSILQPSNPMHPGRWSPKQRSSSRSILAALGNFEDFLKLTSLGMLRNGSLELRPGWSLRLAPLSSVELTVLIESSSDFIGFPYFP